MAMFNGIEVRSSFKDRTGQRYGKLTAVSYVGRDKCGNSVWKCSCDCGGSLTTRAGALTSGMSVSCGCKRLKQPKCEPGQRFGKLLLLSDTGLKKNRQRIWLCRCDCGNTSEVREQCLRTGTTSSCGCKKLKHGKTKTPEFKVWDGMKQRCENPNSKDFYNYGARGITICKRWRESFSAFLEDVGLRPSKEFTIERKDNSRGYEPGNCEWSSRLNQTRNRRNTRFVVFRGEKRKLADVCDELGLDWNIVRFRIRRKTELTESMIESARRRQAAVDRVGGTA